MKTKRRLIILPLLILLIAVLLIPVSADNEVIASGDRGFDLHWEITADGTLTLSGTRHMEGSSTGELPWQKYSDIVTSIVVEDGLTDICSWAFRDMVNVKTVVLGQNIESIGEYAFYGCTALESVNIPLNVKELGEGAFILCSNLTTVEFDPHCALTEIGIGAFKNTGLTSVTLPDRITTIGQGAFQECGNLVEVHLNEGLETIGEEAFRECAAIKSLTIPSTLHTIYTDAFRGLSGLTHLELYTNIDYERDFPHSGVTSVVFHEGMRSVGGFQNCTTLEEVVLPDSVTTISSDAFVGCTALTKIDWPASLTTIESYAFASTGLVSAILPDTVTTLGNSAFRGCQSLTEFRASPGMEIIDNSTLSHCAALTTVDMGNVRFIGFEVFKNCTALTDLQWSDQVESIGYMTFGDCDSLTEITIPTSVTMLDHSMFWGCDALKTVRFLGDAPSIGDSSFRDVTATVYYPAGNPTWTEEVRSDYYGTLTWVADDASCTGLPGDVNGNGAVDADDAIHLLYHTLFGDDLYPVSGNCDFDSSGVVDADDAIYLLYHTLFGAEQYPLDQGGGDIPIFGGTLDVSTRKDAEYLDAFGQTAYAAYIELYSCGDSAAAAEKLRADFVQGFGFEPTAEVQVERLGTYRVEGYDQPQEISKYSIWDTTYPLLQYPLYDIFTQTLADGTLWVGYCVERSEYDNRDEKQWYQDHAWQMRSVLGDQAGIPVEIVDDSGLFELDCVADGGTVRTTEGTVLELVWIYCQDRGLTE